MKTESWVSALLICLLTVQVVLLGLLLLRISIIGQQTQALYNLSGVGTGPALRIEKVVENVATEGRPYKGSADAPVTIVEFSNFTCPACAMVQPTLKELLAVRESQVRLVFRHFPLGPPHTDGFRAAVAAECAAQQGIFWEMHDILFANAEALSENDLLGYAAGLGLDEAAFAAWRREVVSMTRRWPRPAPERLTQTSRSKGRSTFEERESRSLLFDVPAGQLGVLCYALPWASNRSHGNLVERRERRRWTVPSQYYQTQEVRLCKG